MTRARRPKKSNKKSNKKSKLRRSAIMLLAMLVIGACSAAFFWNVALSPNTKAGDTQALFIIDTGEKIHDIIHRLEGEGHVINGSRLLHYFKLRRWDQMRPGRYEIPAGLNNRRLANLLRSGSREAVIVQFGGVRLPSDLAGIVAEQIVADSAELVSALDHENLRHHFIPNSYELYWDVSAKDFVHRMQMEWEKWWTPQRRALAEGLNLSPQEVHVLASIVKAETSKKDEAPIVAGLYLNRLRKGMHLQADPTLIYALGDFSIRRVLDVHRAVDSPYNTYKHAGLPPGPINYPEPVYLEAVLKAENHGYIFMCAREDFSGYHNFAKTYRAHQRNAKRYQRELNKQRVYR